MKTLYFATTSLNFNNIFASESISPAAHYSKRNFGYRSFEKIIELDSFDNSILLYDKIPIFDIKADGRDNHPMIIELKMDIDIKPIKTDCEVNVYCFAESIYINPFTTKIYFMSDEAKKIALLGAERSLSTKMVFVYERNGCFKNINEAKQISRFELSLDLLSRVKDIPDTNTGEQIDLDKRKNKAKGFLYSYLLGANRSGNKELVTIKKFAKEINNIVSAIINSPEKIPTSFQKDDLIRFASEFDVAYKKMNNEIAELDKELKNYGEEISVSVLKQILRNRNLTERILGLFDIKEIVCNTSNFDSVLGEINNQISRIEKDYFSKKQKLNLSEKIHLANFLLTHIEEEKMDFYKALINDYLTNDFQDENKLSVATIGIRLLIKMYEERDIKWNQSTQRDFFNELLANMQGKGKFDITKDNDIIHKSFALFVLHKEKDDIDKLEAALIINLISDYHFAFGLWGAYNGFANMPKTLTNELFLSDDVKYVSSIYKYIFKQVHNIELEGELINRSNDSMQNKASSIPESKNIKVSGSISSRINSSIELEQKQQDPIAVLDIIGNILGKRTKAFKVLKSFLEKRPIINSKQQLRELLTNELKNNKVTLTAETRAKVDQIVELADQIDAPIAFMDNFIDSSSKAYKAPEAEFGKCNKSITEERDTVKKISAIQTSISPIASNEFYLDDNAWNYICDLLYKNSDIRDKVRKNLKHLQKSYRPGEYYDKRNESKKNSDVIDHFLKFCTSPRNIYLRIEQSDLPSDLKNMIRSVLESKYPDK